LVLGHMAELGNEAAQQHREIAAYARGNRLDSVFLVGEYAAMMAAEFGSNGHAFNDKPSLILALKTYLQLGDTVLVKGSRSAAMEVVVDAMAADLARGSN